MMHDFQTKLEFSLGEQEKIDLEVIKNSILGCINVEKTDKETDLQGIDYIATLRKGSKIFIDGKTREKGASKYWEHNEPELALEIWSRVPTNKNAGKIGWTLDERSVVDYILYTFDRQDSDKYYLIPFQLLRVAFRRHYSAWKKQYCVKTQQSERYCIKTQRSEIWTSKAVFVPASVVLAAIQAEMSGEQGDD